MWLNLNIHVAFLQETALSDTPVTMAASAKKTHLESQIFLRNAQIFLKILFSCASGVFFNTT